MNIDEIIISPQITEKTMRILENENKLVFMVNRRANKKQIQEAVERLYEVETENIRTTITSTGEKKALVRLTQDYSSEEIATRLGIF